jgi:hypothetical protein
MSNGHEDTYDVIIAGGGPSGLAAGLFTARYGLSTLIFDRGKSSLRQCAYLDNYLGFPGGIEVSTFLDLAWAHAEDAGCQMAREKVAHIEHAERDNATRCLSGFVVTTHNDTSLYADRIIAASVYDADYLRGIGQDELFDVAGVFDSTRVRDGGRTPIEGLYVAGPLAGVESQALISAGHGASVALALVGDAREKAGVWQSVSRHVDWLVWDGVYQGPRWEDRVRHYVRDLAATDPSADPNQTEATTSRIIHEKQAQQLTRQQVHDRSVRGQQLRSERFAESARQANPSRAGECEASDAC